MSTPRARALRARATLPGLSASAGSYRATDAARSRVRVHGGGGDTHADRQSRRVLRDLSRDLERNAEPYQIFLRGAARLIGAPTPRPTTPDHAWNRAIAAHWRAHAGRIRGGFDARNLDTWPALCLGWWMAALRDGDVARALLATGQIQTIEADCIDAPPRPGNQHRRVVGGLTLGQQSDLLGVWLAPRDANGRPQAEKATEHSPEYVGLLAFFRGTSQTRGVPVMCAGLDNAERVDALVESEIIGAEQASNIFGAVTRQLGQGQVAPGAPLVQGDIAAAAGADVTQASAQGQTIDYVSFPAGSYLDLPVGHDWKSDKPGRPNLDVPQFLRAILSMSAAVIALPYPVIFADFHGINWSGNRGLVSLTRDALATLRDTWCEPYVDPVYGWWLAHGLADGTLPAPPAGWTWAQTMAHEWDWPMRPEWPDPLKEEQRHDLALRLGTSSLHRISGPDWYDILRERAEEEQAADRLAIDRIRALHAACQQAGIPGLSWQQALALSRAATLASLPPADDHVPAPEQPRPGASDAQP